MSPRPQWLATLSRFVVVGGTAAVLLFSLSWLFQRIGLRAFVAGALAYAVSFAFAYTLQRNWTFGGGHRHGYALPRYGAVQAGCAIASGLFAEIAVAGFGWTSLTTSLFTTVGASLTSFVLTSTWVFPEQVDAPNADCAEN